MGGHNRFLLICKNAAYTHLIENLRHASDGRPCEGLPEFIPGGEDGGCVDWDVKDWRLSDAELNDENTDCAFELIAGDGEVLAEMLYAVKKDDLDAEDFLTLISFRSSVGLSCAVNTAAFSPGYRQVWLAPEERGE